MGPLLFSVFINDLPYVVKNADVVKYADDCTLFCTTPTSVELCENLQVELHNFTNWVRANKLALNIVKTYISVDISIIFGSQNILANATALNLYIDGISVEQVNKTKFFVVKLDIALSWSDQIDHIVSRMGRGIAMSR